MLRQFKGFSYFSNMGMIIRPFGGSCDFSRQKTIPVIDFEKNESLKGLIIWI